MAVFGPEDRAAFEEHCVALYEDMVAAGGIAADDPRVAEGADDRPAFDLLVQLGLVSLDADSATWLPEDPAAVQSRVVTPLSAEAGRLLEESSQWARAFGPLRQAWR
ncbi:MAG: LuxR family transcriptional regulator, partial [Nocardioides sp.]|nr:LuxR family transcriptional regulator [Nocardioides sp.]